MSALLKPAPKTMTEKAALAWGNVPDWVAELARMADAKGLSATAAKIVYSTAVISQVIGNKYPGDLTKVEERVRGALMGLMVTCPVLGQIGRDICLSTQAQPFAVTNSTRTRVYRACRSGCPHSGLKGRA